MNFLRKTFRYKFFNASLGIIAVNVVAYFLISTFHINTALLSLNVAGFVYGKMFWQAVTYMFVHGGMTHLFFNMLGLVFFGLSVEKAIGSKEFLLMYFTIGILSGLFSIAVYYFSGLSVLSMGYVPRIYYVSLIGASGAIYGILFAFAVIFPKTSIYVWGIIPVPAPILILAYAIIEFLSQFSRSSNVAHMTHLAGFGFAWLYFAVRMGVNPIKIWLNR